MFTVDVTRKAEKSALKMPMHYRIRIQELIKAMADDPVPAEQYDTIQLENRDHEYRVRIGDIRILYRVFWDLFKVEVYRIEWRGRAYK